MDEATLGVILAGGLARRMGGGDKSLRRLGGRTLIDHVAGRLRPQCAALALNANGDPARFTRFGLPVVADAVSDFAGPLAGILAALDHAAAHHPDRPDVVVVPADAPFIPPDLVARLRGARGQGAALACASSGGRLHPVIGVWRVALRDELREVLASGERRAGRVVALLGAALAEWPTEPFDPFFNVNSPGDLERADAMLPLLRT